METHASFPSCHLVISDSDDCAHSGVAMRSMGMTPMKVFFMIKPASEHQCYPLWGGDGWAFHWRFATTWGTRLPSSQSHGSAGFGRSAAIKSDRGPGSSVPECVPDGGGA